MQEQECIICHKKFLPKAGLTTAIDNMCPSCKEKQNLVIVPNESNCITGGIDWEDPECDLIAAVRQIQEFLDELVVKGKI